MPENGNPKTSVVGEVLEMVEDQLELASLEWQYEKSHNMRRFGALAAGAFLVLTAFVFLQVAMVQGLQALGLTLAQGCLVLTGLYGAIAGGLFAKFGRRDGRVGEAFQGTRQEFHRNLKWIRQLFS